jgi:hypothetical protein
LFRKDVDMIFLVPDWEIYCSMHAYTWYVSIISDFCRYGTAGVGDGEFDTNRAAKGYDW